MLATVPCMPQAARPSDLAHEEVGAWAKRFHHAVRDATDSLLRPHGLGSTQYLVLQYLASHGATLQRDLARVLEIERSTLTSIVATLVRKDLVTQLTPTSDQRQRTLELTSKGAELWQTLPDPVAAIRQIAFQDSHPDDRAIARRVLENATNRLTTYTTTL